MTNPEAKVSPEEILLIIKRALVLLGSALNTISLERRKIAWDPSLKGLATEDYEKSTSSLDWSLGKGLQRD